MSSSEADIYDDEAAATGWLGPEVAFGLAWAHVEPGQTALDLGIGTGLGSLLFRQAGLRVRGMDASPEMLQACRRKGFDDLTRHDLLDLPYPFAAASVDLAVCLGVLHFFADPSPLFAEVARVVREGGVFVFTVSERAEDEPPEFTVEAEFTHTGAPATLWRHAAGEVRSWLAASGFEPLHDLVFMAYMDRERRRPFPCRAWLARKAPVGGGRRSKSAGATRG